jgi:hypothetical protein
MVEAAPAAPLVVSKAQFLFQLLIIAFDRKRDAAPILRVLKANG